MGTREGIYHKEVELRKVGTTDNFADLMTKSLAEASNELSPGTNGVYSSQFVRIWILRVATPVLAQVWSSAQRTS